MLFRYSGSVNPRTKATLRIAYTLAIAGACFAVALIAVAVGGRSGLVYALLFGYASAVLSTQGVLRWRYRRVADSLNFTPLQKSEMTYSVAAVIAGDGRREGCISDAYGGKLNDVDVQTFNYGASSAWWSRTQSVAVVSRPSVSPIDEDAVRRSIRDRADADLAGDENWIIVRARQRRSPRQLPEWLRVVTEVIAKHES